MAIYHYKDSSLIDRMEVTPPRRGVIQGTIVVQESLNASELQELRARLGESGFSTLMDTVDGRAAIQVRGIQSETALLAAIHGIDPTATEASKETTPQDLAYRPSFGERMRPHSLLLSALFYDLGNAAFFASGIQRGRHNPGGKFTINDKSEIMIGAAFSVGDVLMTLYGRHRGDEQLLAAADDLNRHLKKRGIDVPNGDALNPDSLYDSGAMKATDSWLRKHIIHIKCMSESAGGLFTIHSALKPGYRNNGKLAAGLLISTGWLATFLLDKPLGHEVLEGDKRKPDTIAGIMAQNPRGWIAQPLAMANNFANLWGSLNPYNGERKRFLNEVVDAKRKLQIADTPDNRAHLAYTQNKQHDYAWNVVSACSFLVAHALFGLSGAKRPEETQDDKSMMNDLLLLSANMLATQPPEVREVAIGETAEYVSTLSHVRLGKKQLAEAIRDKVENLTHSTWTTRVQVPAAAGQQAAV